MTPPVVVTAGEMNNKTREFVKSTIIKDIEMY